MTSPINDSWKTAFENCIREKADLFERFLLVKEEVGALKSRVSDLEYQNRRLLEQVGSMVEVRDAHIECRHHGMDKIGNCAGLTGNLENKK